MHKQATRLFCLLFVLAYQSGSAQLLADCQDAKQQANREEWQNAIESYNKEIAAHPKDAESLAGRGLAHARQGDIKQAFADFSAAIDSDPNCAKAYSNRSRVYGWLGLIKPAKEDAQKALALMLPVPQDSDSLLSHASLLKCLGKNEEAQAELSKALLSYSKDEDLSSLLNAACAHYLLGQSKETIDCLIKAQTLAPKNIYINYLKAAAYKNAYQWNLAMDELNQHLASNPNNPIALNLRGDCAAAQANYKAAIADYTQAIKLAPSSASAFRSRGFALRILKDYPNAIEDFTSVINLDPTDVFSYAERSYSKCQLKQWASAIKDAQQANAIDPNYALAYRYKAQAQEKSGQFKEAIESLNESIKLQPKNPNGYYERGMCNQANKKYKNAIADFTEAIKLNPNDEITLCARATALVNDKQYESAIADCNQTLKLNVNCTNALLSRGIAYARSGQSKLALQDLDEAIRQLPDLQEAYRERALVYKLLGNEKLYQSDTNKSNALKSVD